MSTAATYTAKDITVLEGLEPVRKRPSMYIGGVDGKGLHHLVWEIIDNAVDEALAGHGDRIDVVLHKDGSVEVRDRARGIPVDIEPKTKLSGVEVVFTKLHAGGKFGGGTYNATGGLHGVGASVVNALSARLDGEVDRGGTVWTTSFRRGIAGNLMRRGPVPPRRRRHRQYRRHQPPRPWPRRPHRLPSSHTCDGSARPGPRYRAGAAAP